MIRGTSVSSGIAQGRAVVIACARGVGSRRQVLPGEVEAEERRFGAALARAENELAELGRAVGERIGASQAAILDAQRLVVRDPGLRERVARIIRERRVNAEAAVSEVIDDFTRTFDAIADTYLRERAADIRDVGRRVLSALIEESADGPAVPEGAIVVSDELLPSATARLELARVRAFVTEHGGRFSHAAILARSTGTPALTGVAGAAQRIRTGDHLVVDAVAGVLFVNPDRAVREEYDRLEDEIRAYRAGLDQEADAPSVTLDGTAVPLLANVNKVSDTEAALLYRAEGIGLFRTEFGFTIRSAFPTEDEQFAALDAAAGRFHPRRVVLRMLDLGGDKDVPYFPLPAARNPSLAPRGIRLLLRHPEVMKPQLRAFLRVSAEHPVGILVPVVGGVDEIREARAAIRQVQTELAAEGKRSSAAVPVGAMIEVPSAALLAGRLARHVEFFSLGTNDLVQYLLAADREDESSDPWYQPLHPAVLRLIRSTVEAAHAAERPLTLCGDMGGNPAYAELLVGLGLREFSVAPGALPGLRSTIRRLHTADAAELGRRALEMESAAEVEALIVKSQAIEPEPVEEPSLTSP
jgi:phosphoenolpyruvate-protein phosphotransferase (PTS system enzyme I)